MERRFERRRLSCNRRPLVSYCGFWRFFSSFWFFACLFWPVCSYKWHFGWAFGAVHHTVSSSPRCGGVNLLDWSVNGGVWSFSLSFFSNVHVSSLKFQTRKYCVCFFVFFFSSRENTRKTVDWSWRGIKETMGNIESVDGQSEMMKHHIMPLKVPMPDPTELEEKFAIVLVSPPLIVSSPRPIKLHRVFKSATLCFFCQLPLRWRSNEKWKKKVTTPLCFDGF